MAHATVFEEHASVLPHWWAQELRGATVVCLDAHLDLQFIAPERITRLRRCATAAELAALASPHPFSPRREACYGIEDFLYAAAQLGMLRRLVWVAPPHVLAAMDSALQALRQMEGVTPEQLASFRRMPDGWIQGRLLGLELAIGEWQQLVRMPLDRPLAVDIDADYFVAVPQDRVWAQPREVVGALKAWLGDHLPLTIARSVGTGFLPLRHRFLADLLAALWEERQEDAAHWQRLLDVEQAPLPVAAQRGALAALHARRPDCAATCHALARACETGPQRRHWRAAAAALDPAYGDDLLRRLGGVRARGRPLDLAALHRLHRELAGWQDSPERQGSAWVALGLLYATFGSLREAMDCDAQSLRHGGGHPDLALQIGRLHVARGEFASAAGWLQRAAADDETRVAAWHQLSLCAARRGAIEEARRWARAAHEAAPAWPEPRAWLARLDAQDRRHARGTIGLSCP